MRIISLSPSTTEILFAIGAGNNITANTVYCDYPDEAKKIPKVGSWIKVDMGKIKSLKPDVIFTSTVVQQRLYNQLKDLGLNVVHFDPRSLVDIYENILEIGRIINKTKEAEELVDGMKKEEDKLRKSGNKNTPKVYIEEWFNPPMISGNWVPDIARLAGGDYSLVAKGSISRKIELDEVLDYQPDFIFLSYCGFGENSNKNYILNRPGWDKLKAVKNHQIFIIDDRVLNRPGPRILQAAYKIRKNLTRVV